MPGEDPRLEHLHSMREKARLSGGEKRIQRQHERGKLTARERLEALLDPGSFCELDAFMKSRVADADSVPGDGVITGYGTINQRLVYAYAQDFTVQGGTLGEVHGKKICRVMDLALQNGAPIIGIIDSGGARIQAGVYSLGGYGDIFRRNVLCSGVIPQISITLGPCAGGAAYSPAVTDLIIMARGHAFMFLTGPDVIKTVTGEIVDRETLGGADIHASRSGTAHFAVDSDEEALQLCRQVLGYLPSNYLENPPRAEAPTGQDDLLPALNSIVPEDPSLPYSMHAVIEQVVDKHSFLEVFPAFAQNAITAFARLDGRSVGIVAQEPSVLAGVLDIDSADKIARFVRLCDCFNIPIITFVDSPGFLPGTDQEYRGIIRHGAKILYAYAEATVPTISVITRKAYGGAYVVLSSKSIGTDINYAWPSAEIAVMGPEGAVNILHRRELAEAEHPDELRQERTVAYREEHCNPYRAAEAGYVNEVIEPSETRVKLISGLVALEEKAGSNPARKHGNCPV